MTKLLYRGHDYVQHKDQAAKKHCVELTYRHDHYNTCRAKAQQALRSELTYRGVSYSKQISLLFGKILALK